jgi:hypothetical protein
MGFLNVSDLGNYYQVFYTITQFLLTKNQISEAEQSRAFIRGFQLDLWHQISCRLEIKLPNHDPDDFYKLTRLQNMFYMAPHKIAFYSLALHRLHPQLSWRHRTSKQKIY